MKKRSKFRIKNRHLLVILTIVGLSLVIGSGAGFFPLRPVRHAASSLLAPFQNGVNRVGRVLADQRRGFEDVADLSRENQELKEKLADLTETNRILQENTRDLADLRELYQLDQDYKDYDKVAADVISRDPGGTNSLFTINKGSRNGIEAGMNVLASGGLAGIVTEVGSNWAKVLPLIDESSNISGMLLTSSDVCILTGDEALSGQGKLMLSQLSADSKVTSGEQVVTSNISDKYLEGILIGYVDSINDDTNHLTKTGTITTAVDFTHLSHVLVIKKTKGGDGK